MPNRIQFSDTIEPLVRFVEETPPGEIVDHTPDKLRAGVPTQTMLTASGLTASGNDMTVYEEALEPLHV